MMKKSKLSLSIAAGIICTIVSSVAYAGKPINEVKKRLTTLEETMPSKVNKNYVDGKLAKKAGKRYVNKMLSAVQLTPGPQGLIGENGAQGPKGDSCTAVQNEGSATVTCSDGSSASVYDATIVDGFNAGDTLFWNGSQWQIVSAAPVDNATYALTSTNGEIKWAAEGLRYEIGQTGPAGGVVFYTTDGGLHGIEMASEDLGPATWYDAVNLAKEYESGGSAGWYLPSVPEAIMLSEFMASTAEIGVGVGIWSSEFSQENNRATVVGSVLEEKFVGINVFQAHPDTRFAELSVFVIKHF
jgi:hypothetical protein